MGAGAFAFIAMLLALGAVVVAGQAFVRSNDAKDAVAAASGTAVSLSEYTIDPSIIAVEEGGSLTVTNDGTAAHNLEIKGTSVKTPDIAPGSSERLHPPDDLVTGHRSWPVRGKVPFPRDASRFYTHHTPPPEPGFLPGRDRRLAVLWP